MRTEQKSVSRESMVPRSRRQCGEHALPVADAALEADPFRRIAAFAPTPLTVLVNGERVELRDFDPRDPEPCAACDGLGGEREEDDGGPYVVRSCAPCGGEGVIAYCASCLQIKPRRERATDDMLACTEVLAHDGVGKPVRVLACDDAEHLSYAMHEASTQAKASRQRWSDARAAETRMRVAIDASHAAAERSGLLDDKAVR